MNKRVVKEFASLLKNQNSKSLLDNDFLISPDSTLDCVRVIIKCPEDSLYRHKYPHSPPDVYFINHDFARIHPNMYEDGKCCATILNTWGDKIDEKWTSSMSIESIIIGFMSLFDNDPYAHEPGNIGNTSYDTYVLYHSWYTCLLEYLVNEYDRLFYTYINEYLQKNISTMLQEIDMLNYIYPQGVYRTECYEIDNYTLNYTNVRRSLIEYYNYYYTNASVHEGVKETIDKITQDEKSYKCSICYDTTGVDDFCIVLECSHEFHIPCIEKHTTHNHHLCPLCRSEITKNDYALITNKFITCVSGKRYRKNGRTFNKIMEAAAKRFDVET
jgi:ubiquitin-protein ligase